MPVQEILMLAVTKMTGGVCIAGMTAARDPITGLQWVRPKREHGHVLLGDIRTPDGSVLCPFDIATFTLVRAEPKPPHREDWLADFRQPPCVVRRLEGERRFGFLEKHLDSAPDEVLDSQQRSLCLIKPAWVRGSFQLDGFSGHYEARLAFGLGTKRYLGSREKGGIPVTDLKFRALGRTWLPVGGGAVTFETGDLQSRLGIDQVYLAIGLTRTFQGACWPMVIGVHTVPDYKASVDYDNL